MTESFYHQGDVVFESPIEYEPVDSTDQRPTGSVDLRPFLRSTAAAIGATAVIFLGSVALTEPRQFDIRVLVSQPRFPVVAVPDAHRRMADRVNRLFKTIPLSASEKIADPDYGL